MPTYCARVQSWLKKLAHSPCGAGGEGGDAAEVQGNQGTGGEQAAQGRLEAQAERLQGTHP